MKKRKSDHVGIMLGDRQDVSRLKWVCVDGRAQAIRCDWQISNCKGRGGEVPTVHLLLHGLSWMIFRLASCEMCLAPKVDLSATTDLQIPLHGLLELLLTKQYAQLRFAIDQGVRDMI